MREFLRGWRRKAGVATLVMAMALCGAWLRSLSIEDEVYFPIGQTMPVLLFSRDGYFVWAKFGIVDWNDLKGMSPHWRASAHNPQSRRHEPLFFENVGFTWRWWICAIVDDVVPRRGYRFFVISYGCLTIPFTLLSAYLILWKPRKRAPTGSPPHAWIFPRLATKARGSHPGDRVRADGDVDYLEFMESVGIGRMESVFPSGSFSAARETNSGDAAI
jgi:hypothetical protein